MTIPLLTAIVGGIGVVIGAGSTLAGSLIASSSAQKSAERQLREARSASWRQQRLAAHSIFYSETLKAESWYVEYAEARLWGLQPEPDRDNASQILGRLRDQQSALTLICSTDVRSAAEGLSGAFGNLVGAVWRHGARRDQGRMDHEGMEREVLECRDAFTSAVDHYLRRAKTELGVFE